MDVSAGSHPATDFKLGLQTGSWPDKLLQMNILLSVYSNMSVFTAWFRASPPPSLNHSPAGSPKGLQGSGDWLKRNHPDSKTHPPGSHNFGHTHISSRSLLVVVLSIKQSATKHMRGVFMCPLGCQSELFIILKWKRLK